MTHATVLDCHGNPLAPCSEDKARKLLFSGRAELVSAEPLTIRLAYAVERPMPALRTEAPNLEGVRLLLHICCGPCSTYTVKRLREQGAQVTGHWFNPNIHPFSEHERRRESLANYAQVIGLPLIWEPGYEMPTFLRAIAGHERFRERCQICYRLRLERAAHVAAQAGFAALSTTLLISPYQDQAAIRQIGEAVAAEHGLHFYFENFRRGFGEHYRLAREHNLYLQRYCGCLYSEWEALDRQAATRSTKEGED